MSKYFEHKKKIQELAASRITQKIKGEIGSVNYKEDSI